MTISVKVTTSNRVTVKLGKPKSPNKTSVASGIIMARTIEDLLDVDSSNVQDKYMLMYDANVQKYVAVNPDDILVNAVDDPISPGLPTQVVVQLADQLDSEIDLDGGSW